MGLILTNLVHKHLIVRATLGYCPDNPEWVKEWLAHLVNVIDMKILSGPHVARVDNVVGNIGCTGVVIIETSHIAVHFWEETGLMQLDVYTCGQFNKDLIFRELACLEPTHMDFKFLDREYGLIEVI
jgi:S-adenosylmethionine/arginine decarboxylase-like enzyme